MKKILALKIKLNEKNFKQKSILRLSTLANDQIGH
jgi:hypothetical protein